MIRSKAMRASRPIDDILCTIAFMAVALSRAAVFLREFDKFLSLKIGDVRIWRESGKGLPPRRKASMSWTGVGAFFILKVATERLLANIYSIRFS